MANKKVKVLKAVVDGKGEGEILDIDSKSADMLVKNGYVELVKEEKKAPKKDEDKDDK
jgi:hypothetical protein